MQIWDTAGQERFRTITQSYYRSANGIILVYDITKRSSFVSIYKWIEEVRRYAGDSVLIAIIGNKADLENLREVEFAEAEALCEITPEIVFVLEASAKTNTNVEEIFGILATELKVGILIYLFQQLNYSISYTKYTHWKMLNKYIKIIGNMF